MLVRVVSRQPRDGDLTGVCTSAKDLNLVVILGIIEVGEDRGGQTLYCSSVYIDKGEILSVHRKLMPTYDERLVWGPGDGHGLQVHPLKGFQISRLNCWENWMPLPRASLYAQGSNVHFAHWPGSVGLTKDITRFIAMESSAKVLATGGSCIAGPNGKWLIEPQTCHDTLLTADLDLEQVREERQNFDPVGHYSRPDVTKLIVNRTRQSTVEFKD
ncbi:hypothetical protein TCAL_15626 [Tigriopus californicus]|uniref:CN hydrolase domain-containing protein n=1 Tax=Tigriopus californicus TaxID=6832 RepID=A0A553PCK3_TIGCA|nr:hypothetical protein TCAL_15626 [Tigriopus californicus]